MSVQAKKTEVIDVLTKMLDERPLRRPQIEKAIYGLKGTTSASAIMQEVENAEKLLRFLQSEIDDDGRIAEDARKAEQKAKTEALISESRRQIAELKSKSLHVEAIAHRTFIDALTSGSSEDEARAKAWPGQSVKVRPLPEPEVHDDVSHDDEE